MRVVTKLAIALLMVWPALAGADPICPMGASFTVRPSGSDVVGNSAGAPGGCFARPGVNDIAGVTRADAAATATPEPASILLVGTGLIALAGTIRRGGKPRRRQKAPRGSGLTTSGCVNALPPTVRRTV